MKATRLLISAAFAATLGSAVGAEANWMTDFEAAKAKAAEQEQAMLLDFTGSDWCGWCIKLKEEVFSKDEFKQGVEDKFVLVKLDFPQDKSGQSEEVQEQNQKLQEKYGITGFPTILLTDTGGKPFARTGYREGGAEKYVEHLDELLASREARDEAFAAAKELEGEAKAEALVSALEAMELENAMISDFYGDKIETIKKADPEDKTGFVAELRMEEKFADFETELNKLARDQDHAGALELTEKTIASGDFKGESLQQLTLIKGMVQAQMGDFDPAMKTLDEAKALDPDSELGAQVDAFKKRIEQMKNAETGT